VLAKIPDLFCDPFAEAVPVRSKQRIHVLGARVEFESNSVELLQLVEQAYANLPRYRMVRPEPTLRIRLQLTSAPRRATTTEPPEFNMLSGAGLLGGATASSSFVVLSPRERAALLAVAPRMLRFGYHTRYELIEFAVFTLAARVQGLVSMHGACVSRGGRAVLLMGPSGAGKSTVTLQALLEGLDLLSEDSVFVTPDTLLAAGVPNFLHLRADSLHWITDKRDAAAVRRSPVIQRRSGVRKFEWDLRSSGYALAGGTQKVCAVVFLSARHAAAGSLLLPLSRTEGLRRMAREQVYAANQPPWSVFVRNVQRLPFYELRRGQHPSDSVAAIREIITPPSRAARRAQRS
jgi:hypothetical protein